MIGVNAPQTLAISINGVPHQKILTLKGYKSLAEPNADITSILGYPGQDVKIIDPAWEAIRIQQQNADTN